MFDVRGKAVIVTGSSMGCGLAIAENLIDGGAFVSICSRHEQIFEIAKELQERGLRSGGRVLGVVCDITSEGDLQNLVQATCLQFGRIDGLVCNASIYGPKGPFHKVDLSDWLSAVQINLVGSALTCRAVIPYLIDNGGGKIVFLSGGGATKPMPNLSAYAASKAGVVRFAETLAEELAVHGIDVNSVAPGALKTRLVDEIIAAGPESVGEQFYQANLKVQSLKDDSRLRAADLCAYLLSNSSDGITGKLISAVWDPWERFNDHTDQLLKSDVYTLRRVVPEDRGIALG